MHRIIHGELLDAPHLNSLTQKTVVQSAHLRSADSIYSSDGGCLCDSVLSGLVQSADVGTKNIENVVGEGMEDLVLKWQIALMSAESTQGDGGLADHGASYPPYAPVSTITAHIQSHKWRSVWSQWLSVEY